MISSPGEHLNLPVSASSCPSAMCAVLARARPPTVRTHGGGVPVHVSRRGRGHPSVPGQERDEGESLRETNFQTSCVLVRVFVCVSRRLDALVRGSSHVEGRLSPFSDFPAVTRTDVLQLGRRRGHTKPPHRLPCKSGGPPDSRLTLFSGLGILLHKPPRHIKMAPGMRRMRETS